VRNLVRGALLSSTAAMLFTALLGVGAQDVADLGALGQQRAVEHALRLARAGGTPRPGSVIAGAGELDLEPYRHAAAR